MRPTSVARWETPSSAAGGGYSEEGVCAAVEKIERANSAKIFSGHRKRREAITRRSEVQILPPQPEIIPRPFGRGIVFCCKMGFEPSTGGLTRGKFFDRRQWRMQGEEFGAAVGECDA